MDKLHDKILFNYLVRDVENTAAVMEAGAGHVVPGIVSDKFASVEDAATKVSEIKTVAKTVSIGLGGGGNTANWKKVLEIAAVSRPGHINQPFETSSYSLGYLDGIGHQKQLVNGLVKPTGEVGKVQLANSGSVYKVEELMEIASHLGIESIKMMPVSGTDHLEELIYLTKTAQAKGIRGVEPAGGINGANIRKIVSSVKDIDIEFFMPHIFGSAMDKETGKTIPDKVKEVYQEVEGL
ncbi:KDGP aldolase [Lentibacillus amyloliquefaciens]|uniref:Imidazolonepropionase n=1 Tax=Lentibacillus amyloliquefaciens TaxID=1472767 RepID=A0A0U4F2K0_9BACI|nr:KDGP aldolase [Lentibacillus amyloliquefaciens]ALX47798.1 imidazolonepropionase [Lentibacillus amyloliquefaciens]